MVFASATVRYLIFHTGQSSICDINVSLSYAYFLRLKNSQLGNINWDETHGWSALEIYG